MYVIALMLVISAMIEIAGIRDREYLQRFATWMRNEGRSISSDELGEAIRKAGFGTNWVVATTFEIITAFLTLLLYFTEVWPFIFTLILLSYAPQKIKWNPIWYAIDHIISATILFYLAVEVAH